MNAPGPSASVTFGVAGPDPHQCTCLILLRPSPLAWPNPADRMTAVDPLPAGGSALLCSVYQENQSSFGLAGPGAKGGAAIRGGRVGRAKRFFSGKALIVSKISLL